MKQLKCVEMGGPTDCSAIISGTTAQEMVENGMMHVETEHPTMAADIRKMTPEETGKWMKEFEEKFAALPEV